MPGLNTWITNAAIHPGRPPYRHRGSGANKLTQSYMPLLPFRNNASKQHRDLYHMTDAEHLRTN
jgi:hypothetical protein